GSLLDDLDMRDPVLPIPGDGDIAAPPIVGDVHRDRERRRRIDLRVVVDARLDELRRERRIRRDRNPLTHDLGPILVFGHTLTGDTDEASLRRDHSLRDYRLSARGGVNERRIRLSPPVTIPDRRIVRRGVLEETEARRVIVDEVAVRLEGGEVVVELVARVLSEA